MVEIIGANAGLVWSFLNEKGETSLKALKKATKLNDKTVWAAIGWLARESKVSLVETEDDVLVSLNA
ncbi:MAG: winged helix-turn-helix domain-containing protein [Bacteroidales bacterium]|nr:winged helix-turn-helix domain-containing protein [Bacteroidales bacterium]